MERLFQRMYGSEKVWAVKPPTNYIILDKLFNVFKLCVPRSPYSATKMVMLVLIFKLVLRVDIM